MNPQLLFRKILSDLRVEVLDEFNQNFTRKAFFDRPWPARKMDTGRGTLLVVSGAMRRSLRCTAAYYRSLALTKKTELDIPQRQVVGDHPAVGRIVRDTCERNVREWVAKNIDPKFTKMTHK